MSFDLNSTAIFIEVVGAGSFVAAAKRLNLPSSTVSDRVAALEKSLGTTLLNRTTRSLQLTDAGKDYYDRCAPAIRDLSTAFTETANSQDKVTGTLRVACPAEFAPREIARAIAEYREKFPDVRVELISSSDLADLAKDRIDLAIRGGMLKDSTLKVKRIGSGTMVLTASPKYLKTAAKLKLPQDLREHPCIGFISARHEGLESSWRLVSSSGQSARVKPNMVASSNSFETAAQLVEAGQGVGFIPDFHVRAAVEDGRLVRVLPEWSSGLIPVQIVYLPQRVESRKVKELIPILTRSLSESLKCLK